MISIYNPDINKYKKSAIDAIESGWISNHGKYVEKSTTVLQDLLNAKHIILMANGTCATHCLFISLKYLYPEISTIYVPNNCYIAAINCVLMEYQMENIEIMKMDEDTWNIQTDEEYILSLKQNAAVLIVHNLGNIINVPRLKTIRPDLIFLEDNCEGLFGKYDGIYSGTSESTLCSSVSFYGNKIITTGEGGAFYTNNTKLYQHIKKVYSQGMSQTRYLHDVHAYNYRMTNIEAAFLYDQLNDISNILINKRELFERYEILLKPLINGGKIKLFKKESNTESADWIFALRIIGNNKTIDETYDFFKSNGIDTRPFFYPVYKNGHFTEKNNSDTVSEILNKEIIMIPSSPSITIEEQRKVIQIIDKFIVYNKNIDIISASENDILEFLPKINNPNFRYFNSRSVECIKNHKCTFLFKDLSNNEVFGYTHIDYDILSNRYWFGIYIISEYRGKKLGELLMNYTIQYSINNCKTIYLSVDSNNIPAIKLYEKYGFIIESENKDKNIRIMKYL
jgi:perosamine synthetase